MKRTILAALLFAAVAAGNSGCVQKRPADPAYFVQPTVAVMKFENRAPFPLKWKLGDGMAEILVDRLVATRRFHVIERPELDSILEELRLQSSGVTRPEARAVLGRIKNVEYLVKGTVTDFGHVASAKGWFSAPSIGGMGSTAVAVMGMTFYVVDVESGEIIASESLEGTVRASSVSLQGEYDNVALGGSVFFRTPLGQATSEVMDDAVAHIMKAVASRQWQPRIASIGEDGLVILNGGRNRRIVVGQECDLLEPGEELIDPETGDTLGRKPAKPAGVIKIHEVQPRYSVGRLVMGDAKALAVGKPCRLRKPPPSEQDETSGVEGDSPHRFREFRPHH
jgi:curli biogenesis system outer membrane secretion channel CsgG